ncbi:hypothetical protein BJX64DRAFT_285012 [Aspergillus heterothallicus]
MTIKSDKEKQQPPPVPVPVPVPGAPTNPPLPPPQSSPKHPLPATLPPPIHPPQSIAHLKFLTALTHLKDTITRTPRLFGIDDGASQHGSGSANGSRSGRYDDDLQPRDEICARVREKVWQVFVSRAVERFTVWWKTRRADGMMGRGRVTVTVSGLKRFEVDPENGEALGMGIEREALPPLDVLMVWHTFMLNPRAYLEDCLRSGKMNLWATPFPLRQIAECITVTPDGEYKYAPGLPALETWVRETDRHWDNIDDPLTYQLECLSCRRLNEVPWTTARVRVLASRSGAGGFKGATGYADAWFGARCRGCETELNHETLPMLRFHLDNIALLNEELPLPGTLFNPNGVVKTKSRHKWTAKWTQLSPNYYFLHFGKPFLDVMRAEQEKEEVEEGKEKPEINSIRHIANLIRMDLYRRDRKIKALDLHTDLRSERLFGGTGGKGRATLRRMMSRYWGGNSSIFALDLVGAVIRQGAFIDKMDKLGWISLTSEEKALEELMDRFANKYNVFWSIIVNNPSRLVVPTLDVDLIWHTHQLSPKEYYSHCIETTSKRKPVRFIDHNDKIDEGRLSDSFEWTAKQYRKATKGGVYSECLCWYCEATRGVGLLDRLSLSSSPKKTTQDTTEEKSTQTGAHVSAHNAVRTKGSILKGKRKKLDKLIANHQRTESREDNPGSKTNPSPKRTGLFFAPDTRVHRDAYINNPSCMNGSTGARGNCITGTCSASMAAGSCGGSSFRASCATTERNHGSGFGFIENSRGARIRAGTFFYSRRRGFVHVVVVVVFYHSIQHQHQQLSLCKSDDFFTDFPDSNNFDKNRTRYKHIFHARDSSYM